MIEATSISPVRRSLAELLKLPGFIFLEVQNPSQERTVASDTTRSCGCLLCGHGFEAARREWRPEAACGEWPLPGWQLGRTMPCLASHRSKRKRLQVGLNPGCSR